MISKMTYFIGLYVCPTLIYMGLSIGQLNNPIFSLAILVLGVSLFMVRVEPDKNIRFRNALIIFGTIVLILESSNIQRGTQSDAGILLSIIVLGYGIYFGYKNRNVKVKKDNVEIENKRADVFELDNIMSNLINCKDCGKEVSVTAKSCPNCGSSVKKQIKEIMKNVKNKELDATISKYKKPFLIGLGIVLVLSFIGAAVEEKNGNSSGKRELTGSEKRQKEREEYEKNRPEPILGDICKDFVRKGLNDPSSAKFEHGDSVFLKNGIYKVIIGVRANNAFGAKIFQEFKCYFTATNRDDIKLVDIKTCDRSTCLKD